MEKQQSKPTPVNENGDKSLSIRFVVSTNIAKQGPDGPQTLLPTVCKALNGNDCFYTSIYHLERGIPESGVPCQEIGAGLAGALCPPHLSGLHVAPH